jgi:hypothetical protein
MVLGLVVLGLVGIAIVLAFLHVMDQMASEREYSVRRKQKRVDPHSDDGITYLGHS